MPPCSSPLRRPRPRAQLFVAIASFTRKQIDQCLGALGVSKTGNKPACQRRLWDACGLRTAKYTPAVQHDRYLVQRAREEVRKWCAATPPLPPCAPPDPLRML